MKNALIHLRLAFSLVLSPLFIWGVYLAAPPGPLPWARVGAAYLVIHVLLYGGMNAFNSYWDRDEGPIGALAAPPPVDSTVLAVALACKAGALVGGFLLGLRFGMLVATAVVLSVLYSHGRWRWKERPGLAALTIFVGQGLLGGLWGWTAVPGGWTPTEPWAIIGLVGPALLTLGIYPLTGVYQIDADRHRGMRTLSVALGVRGCFRAAAVLTAAGGAAVGLTLLHHRAWEAAMLALLIVAVLLRAAVGWYARFHTSTAVENQRQLMQLANLNGWFFTALFLLLVAIKTHQYQ